MNGWVSIHRKLLDNPIWTKERFTRGQAWVDLILLANHDDGYIRVRGSRVNIQRGQIGWSQGSLSKRWKWSRKKVSKFLSELEEMEHQIEQQKNNVTTIISIVNYDYYQSKEPQKEPQKNRKRTTEEPQKHTNNNGNKENKELFDRFWNEYDKKTGKDEAYKLWLKLSKNDVDRIFNHLPIYTQNTPDKQFRLNPSKYLRGKRWNDEIEEPEKEKGYSLPPKK